MKTLRDVFLLRKLQLCRADMVTAISACESPPSPKTLRELADLQLVIMATEAVIADKSDLCFVDQFENSAAA